MPNNAAAHMAAAFRLGLPSVAAATSGGDGAQHTCREENRHNAEMDKAGCVSGAENSGACESMQVHHVCVFGCACVRGVGFTCLVVDVRSFIVMFSSVRFLPLL